MNEVKHITLTIELDVWHPQADLTRAEIDLLLGQLKTKALLAHCGNVKVHMAEGE